VETRTDHFHWQSSAPTGRASFALQYSERLCARARVGVRLPEPLAARRPARVQEALDSDGLNHLALRHRAPVAGGGVVSAAARMVGPAGFVRRRRVPRPGILEDEDQRRQRVGARPGPAVGLPVIWMGLVACLDTARR
jgi:hypothetical protein